MEQCKEFFKRTQFYQKNGRKTETFSAKKEHKTGEMTKFQPKKQALSKKIQNFFLKYFTLVSLSNGLLFDLIKDVRY